MFSKRLRRPPCYALFLVVVIGVAQVALHQVSIRIFSSSPPDWQVTLEGRLAQLPESAYMPQLSAASKPLTRVANTTRPRAVFYNIYVPEGEFEEHALGIVKEQLALKQASKLLQNVPIYYTVIGTNATEKVTDICHSYHGHGSDEMSASTTRQNCHLLQYVSQGDERLTLQAIYDYCINHPQYQISYIHNKGSFHPSGRNEKFRAFLNHGIFGGNGDHCQEMPLDQCNVCGTRFATFPHYHMAGNIWTATCQYIRQLIPPMEFPSKMEALLERTLFVPDPDIPKPTFQQYSEGYPVGRDRYSLEHWLGSHPYLQPCDIYSRKYTHGYRDLPTPHSVWKAKLATAPRFDIHTFLKISMLRGEWFCGQARLWEYAYLYDGLQPDRDHFVWKYYSDPYKGCDVPLDYRLHNDMFLAKLRTNHTSTLNNHL